MKVFIDWAIKKDYTIIYENDDRTVTNNTSKTLNLPDNCEVYVESGCPKYLLYTLIEEGKKIFICSGKVVKEIRDKTRIKKSDVTDVSLLQTLYHKNPSSFVELLRPHKDDLRFEFLMGKYEKVNKAVVSFKNRRFFVEKEYGEIEVYDNIIKQLSKEKKKILSEVEPLIIQEIHLIKYIRGINIGLTARLLAVAHPKKFPTLSRYLGYCGYKGYMLKRFQTGKGQRPNYRAKSILYLMAEETMMKRDPVYRKVYDECKVRYSEEHPDWTKGQIHGKALSVVATLIGKEFWLKFHFRNGHEEV